MSEPTEQIEPCPHCLKKCILFDIKPWDGVYCVGDGDNYLSGCGYRFPVSDRTPVDMHNRISRTVHDAARLLIIKTQGDYDAAMARLSQLMSAELAPGSSDEAELEVLALLIEDYESKAARDVGSAPGQGHRISRAHPLSIKDSDILPARTAEQRAEKAEAAIKKVQRRIGHRCRLAQGLLGCRRIDNEPCDPCPRRYIIDFPEDSAEGRGQEAAVLEHKQ